MSWPTYLEDENPCPSRLSANATHLSNSCGQQSTKGAGERGCGEEDSGTDTEFGALVPATEVVVDTGKEPRFCQTEEEAGCGEA